MNSNALTVIIPTYNRLPQLKNCFDGLATQKLPINHIVIVNDGDQDIHSITMNYNRQLNIQLIQTPNLGPTAARNEGLKLATSKYVAFLDDDSIPDPQWSDRIIHMFESYPFITAQTGRILRANSDKEDKHINTFIPRYRQALYDSRHDLYTSGRLNDMLGKISGMVMAKQSIFLANHFSGNNASIRLDELKRFGDFNPKFKTLSDREMAYRIYQNRGIVAYNPNMIVRHSHDPSILRPLFRCVYAAPYEKMIRDLYPELNGLDFSQGKNNYNSFITPITRELTLSGKFYYLIYRLIHSLAHKLPSIKVEDPLAMKKSNFS